MSTEQELSARIEKLETTVAFQDQTIEDLNTALAEHYKQIEALKRELHNLGAALRDVEAHPALAVREPPPPHY
jgi:SlyX protein